MTNIAVTPVVILGTSGRWPESVARKGGPNDSPSFATCAPQTASAPMLGTSAFGAPWANVGALVALIGESEIARFSALPSVRTGSTGPRPPSAARSVAARDARSGSASARKDAEEDAQ